MDSQRVVVDFDSVKAEKANAMRRYRWRQNLRWLLKACVPLAPLSYALCRDAPRQLLIAVFNSNLCVFLLLNALVVVTCVLSGENNNKNSFAEPDIYGEYVSNLESTRHSGFTESELITPEAKGFVSRRSMVAGYESPAEPETTMVTEEVPTESYVDVNAESPLPVCEDKAVTSERKIVVSPVSAVTTNTSGEEGEKVKSYRRTQSESFEKKRTGREPKRGLERSTTEINRNKTEPESLSSVEDLSDQEFQRRVELFINSKKMFQRIQ